MRIGIVTPAFNIAPYIGDTIRSVLAQTYTDWTMTIVDDGSTDETASIAGGFGDPRIRVIRQRNAGVSRARNRGLAATKAGAILFLDGDDWLDPSALAALLAALRADPAAIAAVGPYALVSGVMTIRRPRGGDLLRTLLVRNLFANGGHVLIHADAANATGAFHPGLKYGEDWEYWTRLACLGPFTAAAARAPLLFVRERADGAYRGMAVRPESFRPCVDAIFNAPGLRARFTPAALARLRRATEAENDWIVGRELIRHGKHEDGLTFLRRSVRAAPGVRRIALLAAGAVPITKVGPFRPYPVSGTVRGA